MPTRIIFALAVIFVVGGIPLYGNQKTTLAQASEQLGTADNIDCPNFRSEEDGGVDDVRDLFGDFPDDPYNLDNNSQGDLGRPCEDASRLGTETRLNCQSFLPANRGGQEHAQSLFGATRADNDPYNLDPNEDGRACSPDAPSTPPTPTATSPTLGERACTADTPQITTSLHAVCAGSYAKVTQPGFGTISVTLPNTITITPLTAPTGGTLGTSNTGNTVTTQQEAGTKDRKRERKKLRKQRPRDRQTARDAFIAGFRR